MKKIILLVLALFLLSNYNSVEIRPNIIWLVAEDQSVNFFPMYGDETIDLPNLSSLREDGILYENAYSPVPVCAPARSSIITGMYPTSLGTHNMRTYAEFPQPKPSKDIINYSPVPISNVKMFTEYLRKNNYYTLNYGKEDYNFKKTDGSWDYSCTGGSCSQKLEPLWRESKRDQPFFAVFNFGITHESQVWSQGDKELYVNPDEINVPPIFPDTAEVRKDLAVNYSNLIRLDKQIGEIIDLLITDNNEIHEFKSLKIPSKQTHGTGCTLASAIATNIAFRRDIPQCIETSIKYVQRGITNAPNFGQGNGPIRHF